MWWNPQHGERAPTRASFTSVPGVALLVSALALALAGGCTQALDFDAVSSHAASECDHYCDAVMDMCQAELMVYLTREACMGMCEQLDRRDPPADGGVVPLSHGDAGSEGAVACRMRQVELARSTGEPATYCPQAGPGGQDVCESNCESYCRLLARICPDDHAALPDCAASCAAMDDNGGFRVQRDQESDTVQCRIAHLSSASLDPATHCAHARIDSTLHCLPDMPEPPAVSAR